MNCQNCKKEFDNESVFCKFCGTKLQKVCPVCNKLEWIDDINQGICRTEIENIKKQKVDFIAKNLKVQLGSLLAKMTSEVVLLFSVVGMIIFTVITVLLMGINPEESGHWKWLSETINVSLVMLGFLTPLFFLIILLIPGILISIKRKRAEKKIEKIFSEQFPDYEKKLQQA